MPEIRADPHPLNSIGMIGADPRPVHSIRIIRV
jgi:hypothetical protein